MIKVKKPTKMTKKFEIEINSKVSKPYLQRCRSRQQQCTSTSGHAVDGRERLMLSVKNFAAHCQPASQRLAAIAAEQPAWPLYLSPAT